MSNTGGEGPRKKGGPLPSVGTEVTGKVTRTAGFGVFLEFGEGLRGLLHVDEMVVPGDENGREPNVQALFNVGDEVKVRHPP